jgi:hypothetical protein
LEFPNATLATMAFKDNLVSPRSRHPMATFCGSSFRRTNVVLRPASISLHAASYYYDEASRMGAIASGTLVRQFTAHARPSGSASGATPVLRWRRQSQERR